MEKKIFFEKNGEFFELESLKEALRNREEEAMEQLHSIFYIEEREASPKITCKEAGINMWGDDDYIPTYHWVVRAYRSPTTNRYGLKKEFETKEEAEAFASSLSPKKEFRTYLLPGVNTHLLPEWLDEFVILDEDGFVWAPTQEELEAERKKRQARIEAGRLKLEKELASLLSQYGLQVEAHIEWREWIDKEDGALTGDYFLVIEGEAYQLTLFDTVKGRLQEWIKSRG